MLTKKIGGLFVALSLAFSFAEAAELPGFIEDTPENRRAYMEAKKHIEENANSYRQLAGCRYYGRYTPNSNTQNLVTHLRRLKFTGYAGKKEWGTKNDNEKPYYQDVWCNDSHLCVRVKRYSENQDSFEGQFTIGVITYNPNTQTDWRIKRDVLTYEDNEIAKFIFKDNGQILSIAPRLASPKAKPDLELMKTAHKNLVGADSPDRNEMDIFEIR